MTTTNKQLNVPPFNTPNWDVPLNNNFEIIDKALGSYIELSPTSSNTYVISSDDLQNSQIYFEGTLTGNANAIIPDNISSSWIVGDYSSGGFTITMKTTTGSGVTVPKSTQTIIASDGYSCYEAIDSKFNITGGQISGNLSLSGTFNIGSGKLTFDPTAVTPQLYVNGTIYATGNVTAFSDERLKHNVSTIEGALDLVKKMRGVRFEDKDGNKYVGLIAQELQPVVPEAVVKHEESGYLAVAYQNLVGVLVNAINDLSARVDKLEKK